MVRRIRQGFFVVMVSRVWYLVEGVVSSCSSSVSVMLCQHMAASVRVRESREWFLATEEEIGPIVVS